MPNIRMEWSCSQDSKVKFSLEAMVILAFQKNSYEGVPWETYYKRKIWKLNSTFFKVHLYNCNSRYL
jgi:hypothetical protein